MKTKTIKQKISFKASVHDVYEALMDSRKHARLTGGSAQISRKVGGKFSVYDGYATGKNIEIIEDKKIVQSWRAGDWEDGDDSEVTYLLTRAKNGCALEFTQRYVPIKHFSAIKKGWTDFYWRPMKEMLKNG